MSEGFGLNRRQWEEKLAAIGEHLRSIGSTATLEVIGAWPVMEAGLEGRTSLDLDVWMPASDADRGALAKACMAAGLDFNPTGETDRPYMQLVQPGIIEMPEHVPVEAGRWGALTIITPPPAALAAMKLMRAEPKDIADVLFLCSRHGLGKENVAHYARRIRDPQKRQTAEENLVYLEGAR